MDGRDYRKLVSGERKDLSAQALRGLLGLAEHPYRWITTCRNLAYDRSVFKTHRAAIPVVSIGNLSMGGTGKTPLVVSVARWYQTHDWQPVILSRGYGAMEDGQNDEARELARQLPDVPHLQARDRVASAQRALSEYDAQVLILDDGFQHRRLARDLDIVLLDATCPWGYGHVVPRGMLREDRAGLRRADFVCLSRADAVLPATRESIREQVRAHAGEKLWMEMSHCPTQLVNRAEQTVELRELRGQPVAAFCGLGNPAGFRHTLQQLDYDVRAWREFPDHHPFPSQALDDLDDWLKSQPEIAAVLCTCKDLVKIPRESLGGRPLWAVEISGVLSHGQTELEAALAQLVEH